MAQHGWTNAIIKDAIKTQTVDTKAGIFIGSRIPTNEQKSILIMAGIPWDKKSQT